MDTGARKRLKIDGTRKRKTHSSQAMTTEAPFKVTKERKSNLQST